jgi:hypothetical protein
MIHNIALGQRPLRIKLHDTVFTITKISHDDGELSEFVCEPHSEELKKIFTTHLEEHRDLKMQELDKAVSKADKRR